MSDQSTASLNKWHLFWHQEDEEDTLPVLKNTEGWASTGELVFLSGNGKLRIWEDRDLGCLLGERIGWIAAICGGADEARELLRRLKGGLEKKIHRVWWWIWGWNDIWFSDSVTWKDRCRISQKLRHGAGECLSVQMSGMLTAHPCVCSMLGLSSSRLEWNRRQVWSTCDDSKAQSITVSSIYCCIGMREAKSGGEFTETPCCHFHSSSGQC